MNGSPDPTRPRASGLPTAPLSGASSFAELMQQRYASRDTPWDTGIPEPELVRVVEAGLLPGRSVLEMGCGTGTNAIELARRGYAVTAVDFVPAAIDRARRKATEAGVDVDFRVGDITTLPLEGPYDVLFDLGLYHGIRQRDLAGFLGVLDRVARPGTRWLSIAGNAKEPLDPGPPVVREDEFRSELGSRFTFVEVREFRLKLRPDFQPLVWSILMERRQSGSG